VEEGGRTLLSPSWLGVSCSFENYYSIMWLCQ